MVPYLRTTLFPPSENPALYAYRSLADRLRKKVKRAYRRANLTSAWTERNYEVTRENARSLTLPHNLTIGGFLGTTVPGIAPPISFLEFYVSKIEFAAQQIVPT